MKKTTFYTTIENQGYEGGGFGLLYDHFSDYNQAMAKFFTICAAAAVSEIPFHAAYVIRSDGLMIEGRTFDRRTDQEPAPEPEAIEEIVEGGE